MLRSGWTLLGDLRKFVPLSPQRFVVADADAPSATALRFQVLGSAGEAVPVTVVAPSEVVRVVQVTLGPGGSATVRCATDEARPRAELVEACAVSSDQ